MASSKIEVAITNAEQPRCETCVFWNPDPSTGDWDAAGNGLAAQSGFCHRSAPSGKNWPPASDANQWCGEWSGIDFFLIEDPRCEGCGTIRERRWLTDVGQLCIPCQHSDAYREHFATIHQDMAAHRRNAP